MFTDRNHIQISSRSAELISPGHMKLACTLIGVNQIALSLFKVTKYVFSSEI